MVVVPALIVFIKSLIGTLWLIIKMFEPLSQTSKCECCNTNIIFYATIKYTSCPNCKTRYVVVGNGLEKQMIDEKSTFANSSERRLKLKLNLKTISENPISLINQLKPASLIVMKKGSVKRTPIKSEEIKSDLPNRPNSKPVSKVDGFNQLQKACDNVYNAILVFSSLLDENGGKISGKIRTDAELLDLEIRRFLKICNSNRNEIGAVMWNGKATQLMGILLTINAFMNEVLKLTGYRFRSLDWMKTID